MTMVIGPRSARALPEIRHTTTFRLVTTLGVMFVIAVIALLGLTYVLTAAQLTSRSDQVLFKDMHELAGVPRAQLPNAVDGLIVTNASGLTFYGLVGPDGRKLAGNIVLPDGVHGGAPFDLPAGSAAAVPLRAIITRLPDGTRVEVARDTSPIIDLRHRIFAIMATSGLAVILIALVAGWLLSLGPLRRVAQFRAVAMRIATGELGPRMTISRRSDELDLIAGMINAMLDEIERLMEQVKGATDAIAHDLRTPLAHLRHRLQTLARRATGAEADPDPAVAEAIVDIDMVLRRFNALLRISELEASGRQAGFGPVDPMTLLADIAELYEPLAEERGIGLSLEGAYGHDILGDETLLLEVVSNLVENALKFVNPGGQVALSVRRTGDAIVIAVCDNGPGIPEAERELVLGRFRRGSGAARTTGMGLGLNLVAAIVNLHGFALSLEDAEPGLCVRIACQGRENAR